MAEGEDETKYELAEDRTEWAQARTILAKERTFSAWVRTGLASIAAGLGVTRLLQEVEPLWMVSALGTLLVFMGAASLVLGFWSYHKTLQRLKEQDIRGVPVWVLGLFTLGLLVGAGIGLALILMND